MAFISLASVNNTAPGLFVTERSSGAIAPAIATFNSTYMLVECDDDIPVDTFPFFTPVQVVDLDDYVNRIGGLVPVSGSALTSYNSVKLYFRNAGAAILYVVRVGRPEQIVRITFDGNTLQKRDELGATTALSQGDQFYVRAEVNGFPIGLEDVNGVYLGVPVVVSEALTGNTEKAALAAYIRDQVIFYISNDISISSSVYIRAISSSAVSNTQHYLEISPRVYGQNLEYVLDPSLLEDNYVSTAAGHTVSELNPSNETTYLDYIQAVQTSFRADLAQGYLIAPAAFEQFPLNQRLAIGTAMENLCATDEYNWFAIVDSGPDTLDIIETYDSVDEFLLSEDYVSGNRVKHREVVYEFTDNYTAPVTTLTNAGLVDTLTIVNAGTGYTNGSYAGVATTGGSGTGLTVNVTVVGTVVTVVAKVAPGSGYLDGDLITVSNTLIGGTGSGLSVQVKTASAIVANNATVILAANPGNNFLKNGITVNDVHYDLPISLTNSSGGSLAISNINPLSGTALDELENDISAFVIRDNRIVINGLIRANDVTKIESAIINHGEAYKESQLYTTPLGYLAYYAPYVIDLEGFKMPPSAAVAGVAVRRYASDGFQNPPAGVTYALRGVVGVSYEITRQHQSASNPKGLNAIRNLNGQGIVIWGARTRSTNPYYRWVNTRIILNVIIGTVRPAFDSLIFNAVDGQNILFNRIKATAETILYRFWVGGALFGNTAGDAYQVICDRRNNPNIDLEDGLVRASLFVVPVPTLERLQIEIVRTSIGEISATIAAEGFN